MRVVLTLNSGSSSVKFGLFTREASPVELLRGQVSGLGGDARLKIKTSDGETKVDRDLVDSTTHLDALHSILEQLPTLVSFEGVAAVGHRIVFGGAHYDGPVVLDDDCVKTLEGFSPFAPLHQPYNLAGIHAAREAFPDATQVGCFDTAFHRTQAWVHETFALPRRFYDDGVRRYGFHGLSYQFISEELARGEPELATGRVAIAHLGNGASMAAVRGGRSVATTMGFTALDGLPMGTRCGQLDPGAVLYMVDQLGMSADEITRVLYRESGLLGLSGESNDMRELLESGSPSAQEAVSYFVARVQRELGSLVAAMGGLDAFVFCGGIGENSPAIRERVCAGLEWLGVSIDRARNEAGDRRVSADDSAIAVLAIATNEEWVIARAASACAEG